jgi:hypothetical protein
MYIYYNDGSSSQWISISGYASSFDSASAISLIDSDYVQSRQTTAASTTIVTDINGLIAISSPSNGDQAYVQSNNNLYFYDSGWYKIATVANDSPSSITGVSGSYALDISGGTTVITAVSTDPEGFPLTWSYSTTGLGSIATISQASNVFTITPSTNSANAGSFTLTISVTDGVNGAVSTSSTLTLQFAVTNSKYTTRLLTAVDTFDNNNITDASSNNHTITVTGDTAAGTFSPYRHGGYSTYFDGTGDYLTTSSNNLLALGTGDFTVECWINKPDTAHKGIWQISSNSAGLESTNYLQTLALGYQAGVWQIYVGGQGSITGSSFALSVNTWYHTAVVRNSGTTKLYINGTEEISVSDTYNYTGTYMAIGGYYSTTYLHTGHIRDVRVIKGTAQYTSAFTPPTEPLTAISGTSLLTCHLPYIADGSSNNYIITPIGNVSTEPWSFYNYSSYSAGINGGSVYFDGTGDWLRAPHIDFGTGDFCIEGWVYRESVADQIVFSGQTVSGGSTDNVQLIRFSRGGTGNHISTYFQNSYIFQDVSSDAVAPGQWFYCALTRSVGTIVRLFINGKIISTNNGGSGTSNSIGFSMVGAQDYGSPSLAFNGYISDFKVTAGSAVYTADFTPPASPLSSSGAALHIKGTDASIIDKSQGTNLVLPSSGVSGSTSQVKFASTKSIYFTGGSAAGVDLGTNLFLDALNTEYTLEMWYYPTQTGTDSFLMTSYISSSTGRWMLYQQGTDNRIRFFGNLNGTREVFTTAVSANNWYHVAVVRKSNGYISIFLNGTETELAVDLNGYATVLDRPVLLGSGDTFSTSGCQGYIQDVRITKGLARYTSNFTPPTSELQG